MHQRGFRSSITTQGRRMAGARALWRATGMKTEDFRKPIIAIANSFAQFVPGHVHLHPIGQRVKQVIDANGGYGVEFNTIALDDGIAMGHDGMLYSLPSRELIADSVEYMVNGHKADALVCISNCDKITPGMLLGALRLNLPTIFVSGGPMEAGRALLASGPAKLDLVDSMVAAGDSRISDAQVLKMEEEACPTCGSCSGMFTANSMNCLNEAIGLALPGNGTILATHALRWQLFERAAKRIVRMARAYYLEGDESVLPRNIATFDAFENAMSLDIAMGGSTNTVLHILAMAREAEVDFTMADIDRLSRQVPCICKVAPATGKFHLEDVARAGGIPTILGELQRAGKIHSGVGTVSGDDMGNMIRRNDLRDGNGSLCDFARRRALAAPGGVRTREAFSQESYYQASDLDSREGCIRSAEHAYSRDGGLAVLYGNLAEDGCIVKTAGCGRVDLGLRGTGPRLRIPGGSLRRDPGRRGPGRGRGGDPVRGPQGRPGDAGDALSDLLHQGPATGRQVRAADGWALQRRDQRIVHRTRLPRGGRGRSHRPGGGGRPDPDRHSQPNAGIGGPGRRADTPPSANGGPGPGRLPSARPSPSHLPGPGRLCRPDHQRRPGRRPRHLPARVEDSPKLVTNSD